MIEALKTHGPQKIQAKGSQLIGWQCSSCGMLSWQKAEIRGPVTCPFCFDRQPDYITKVVRETTSMHETKYEALDNHLDEWHSTETAGECDGASPFVREFFFVQGSGFRCMAYRNPDGRWRGAFDNEELPGAIRVLE